MESITSKTPKEAKTNGHRYYFTGKECKNGHISKRYTSSRKCIQCEIELQQTKEYKAKRAIFRTNNIEMVKAREKKWRYENRELKRESDRKWYKNNKERCREWGIAYRAGDKREEILEKKRKYTASNRLNKKLYDSATQHYRKNRKDRAHSDGTVTVKFLSDLFLKQDKKCFHCSEPLDFNNAKNIHLDHLVSIANGGLHTQKNVAWTCAKCNCTKNMKNITVPNTMHGLF